MAIHEAWTLKVHNSGSKMKNFYLNSFFMISQLKEVLGPKYVKNISSRSLKNIQTETT